MLLKKRNIELVRQLLVDENVENHKLLRRTCCGIVVMRC
ncbi:hypothetical protein B224_4147 [Aeromonas media WS]|nr:hypothetical protein B224_4147 [Aeromonas media WS]